jgi:predicted AlkP superfamily pyrophosphatase or phosphodiesterase
MVYLDEPDGAGHRYGPASEQTGRVVHALDSLIGVLMTNIEQSPMAGRVNLIVTSDHGMAEISLDRIVRIDDYLKPSWYERISGNNPASIFTREGCRDSILAALANAEHVSAYRREDIPPRLHYGTNRNIGDVLVIPDCGWQFTNATRSQLGAHGYDPDCLDMHVIFYAAGPDFKQNHRHHEINNTDIYLLLAQLLGIKPEECDGDFERVKGMLRGY